MAMSEKGRSIRPALLCVLDELVSNIDFQLFLAAWEDRFVQPHLAPEDTVSEE